MKLRSLTDNLFKCVALGHVAVALAGGLAAMPRPARAATFTVTTLEAVGAGSFAQAIDGANAADGPDVIEFASTVTGIITPAELLILDAVTINGPGAAVLAISGGNLHRVLDIDPPEGAAVTLRGLTLQNGNTNDEGGGVRVVGPTSLTLEDMVIRDNVAAAAGGLSVRVDGGTSTTILRTTFAHNYAHGYGSGGAFLETLGTVVIDSARFEDNDTAGPGGAMVVFGDGPLTITGSTFSGNQALEGGAIYFKAAPPEPFVVTRSTMVGNQATELGGALAIAGTKVRVTSCTLVDNKAKQGAGIFFDSAVVSLALDHLTVTGNEATPGHGAIESDGNPATMVVAILNSVVKGNSALPRLDIAAPNGRGFVLSNDLIGERGSTAVIPAGGNLPADTDPKLRPLGDYGGPTQTRPPEQTSPLIDAGDPTYEGIGKLDQIGGARVVGVATDIGAVELVPCPEAGCDSTPAGEGEDEVPKDDDGGCSNVKPHASLLGLLAALVAWRKRH